MPIFVYLEKRNIRAANMFYIVLIYVAFLIYGSLDPFSGWAAPAVPLFSFLNIEAPSYLDKGDMILNVLVYMPFGLLTVLWMRRYLRFSHALILATLAGTWLSFMMESIQQFLPSRISSAADVIMNFSGTLAGGMLASFFTRYALFDTNRARAKK